MLDAHGFDMACAVRIQLDSGDPETGDMLRIHLTCDVAFDNADPPVLFQSADERGDKACLSGSGAAHHVDHTDVMRGKSFFYFFAHIFIPVHYLMQYFYLHRCLPPSF